VVCNGIENRPSEKGLFVTAVEQQRNTAVSLIVAERLQPFPGLDTEIFLGLVCCKKKLQILNRVFIWFFR